MAGEKMSSKSSSNPTRVRKRVEVDSSPDSPPPSSADASAGSSLKRARDGSAFTRCDGCNRDVAVALISFHDCSLDAKIKLNLEAQVVDMPAEAKKKPAEKRKAKTTEQKGKDKKAKNPNAPKRPQTAFFVFMEDFRKSFKENNPDCKKVSTVAKEGGVKWKSMSDEEKKPYIDKAAELKAEYGKGLESNHDDAENENENENKEDEMPKEEKQENIEDEE